MGITCQYFLVRSENEMQSAISTILRSLACQLANLTPRYAQRLRELVTPGTEITDQNPRDLWRLLYKQGLFPLGITHPIHLVIDGLDEADDLRSLLSILVDFRSSNIPVCILVASRRKHEVAVSFRKLEERQFPVYSVPMDENVNDIRRYIEEGLDFAGYNPLSTARNDTLGQTMVNQAASVAETADSRRTITMEDTVPDCHNFLPMDDAVMRGIKAHQNSTKTRGLC